MSNRMKIDSADPVMMAKCRPDGTIFQMSKVLADYLGFDCSHIECIPLLSLIHKDDKEVVESRFAEAHGNQAVSSIHKIMTADDIVRNNLWIISPDPVSSRKTFYQIIISDIEDVEYRQILDRVASKTEPANEGSKDSHRNRLELRLQAAEEHLKWQDSLLNQLAEISPVAFIILDDRTQDIIYVSDHFCEVWNLVSLKDRLKEGKFKFRELMGACLSLVNNKSVFIQTFVNPKRQHNGQLVEDLEFIDGKLIRGYSKVIRIDNRGYLGRLCIFEDITERRRLINELIQNQKIESLGALTGNMATDFDSVMGLIAKHIKKIRQDPQNAKKVTTEIRKLDEVLMRAETLVKQIQIFSQRSKPQLEKITITQIIIEIVSLLREIFLQKISVVLDLESNLPRISADKLQLNHALLNICLNARDAMPSGGQIDISVCAVKDEKVIEKFKDAQFSQYIRIDIRDSGMGMDKKTMRRIFEPFFTTKGSERGTGLGMPVVQGIIESHQGHLEIESSPGNGTICRIYLPCYQEAVKKRSESASGKILGKGSETILLIEDEYDLLECLQELLEMEGYNTITATNGPLGLERYQENKNKISLVFSDKGLPGMDGEIVMQKIREINPKQKYIMASGFIDVPKNIGESRDENLFYLQKPYKMDIIIKKVRDILDR